MIIYIKKQFSIFHPHKEDLEHNFHQFIIYRRFLFVSKFVNQPPKTSHLYLLSWALIKSLRKEIVKNGETKLGPHLSSQVFDHPFSLCIISSSRRTLAPNDLKCWEHFGVPLRLSETGLCPEHQTVQDAWLVYIQISHLRFNTDRFPLDSPQLKTGCVAAAAPN